MPLDARADKGGREYSLEVELAQGALEDRHLLDDGCPRVDDDPARATDGAEAAAAGRPSVERFEANVHPQSLRETLKLAENLCRGHASRLARGRSRSPTPDEDDIR
jgi:hypothetical protein